MCGRINQIPKSLKKAFHGRVPYMEQPRVNASVGEGVVVEVHEPHLKFMQFGLTPFWAKKRMYFFNARCEGKNNKENKLDYRGAMGVFGMPAFRDSINTRRCVVPVDSFIEGPAKERLSKPYLIYREDRELISLAAIWSEWTDKDSGEVVQSFSLLTRPAIDICQRIGHHRSPVILNPGEEESWIDSSLVEDDLRHLINRPIDFELNAHPISPLVKSGKDKRIELLEPTGDPII